LAKSKSEDKEALFFRIGEAAKLLGVSPSSLRNWEQMGLLTPVRSQGRYRLYSRESLERLKRIRYLRTVKRVNPAGIAAIINSNDGNIPAVTKEQKRQGSIGRRLQRLRKEMGLTLQEMAEKTGVAVSFLSGLERGHAKASIATLQKLAREYKTNVLSFFGEESSRKLVREKDRKVLTPDPGVRMELLAFGTNAMEPHLFRIAPGATSGGSYTHEGEEFIYVIQGSLEIWLDEVERYILEAGDSFYFESSLAHRWESRSEGETVLIWVNTPATF
jgi:DNA-binding transcriptional MerR regulator/quercetin dioxygenase-like cupin family protein